jgi:iron complex outermembrane receptor protein
MTYTLNFAGIRYTTSDNSRYLPGYFVDDLRFAKRLTWGKSHFDLQFSINNLTAQNYQVIAWQPMPGRNYRFSLSYKFRK